MQIRECVDQVVKVALDCLWRGVLTSANACSMVAILRSEQFIELVPAALVDRVDVALDQGASVGHFHE